MVTRNTEGGVAVCSFRIKTLILECNLRQNTNSEHSHIWAVYEMLPTLAATEPKACTGFSM